MTESEYTELYTATWKKTVNLCKKLLGTEYIADAEDCAQEAFIELWKKREAVTVPAEKWVNETARRKCLQVRELGQRYDQWGMPLEMEGVIQCARRLK